ncbi:MAG: hypothetical protein KAJ95_08065 [Gammaproteobacteria bacterium]|nr:hypothetical protein [Gammaproteobacteria bacterium]
MLFSEAESFIQSLSVFAYIASIILIEVLILFFISLYSEKIFLFVLGLALTANILSLKLLFSKTVQAIPDINLILSVAIPGLMVGVVLILLNRSKKIPGVKAVVISGIIFIVIPIANAQYKIFKERHTQEEIDKSDEVLQQWSQLRFKEKPNIHLISIDSMIPLSILSEYLDISELPYEETLIASTLRKPISYSPRVPSNPSMNSIMQLDQAEAIMGYSYFAGRKPSVLTSIFASNDYEISTGFFNYYFGKKGSYIDSSLPSSDAEFKNTLLCLNEGKTYVNQMRFFGICTVFGGFSSDFNPDKNMTETAFLVKAWPSQVLDVILQLSRKTRPQISFHYIYKPIGHTRNHFRHNNVEHRSEYKKYYLENAAKLNEFIKKLLSLISNSDPNSIVVIFGDHGALLSRGVSADDNPEFVYKDLHMIELAVVKTENRCSSDSAFHYSDSYATPSRVIAGIIRCLSETPKEIDKIVDFIDLNTKVKELEDMRLKREK